MIEVIRAADEPFISALLDRFEARIEDAAAFARANRVLLVRASSGVGLDIALGALPFEESVVVRSTPFTYPPSTVLRTCSAEDLVVLKAFAGRTTGRTSRASSCGRPARWLGSTFARSWRRWPS